MYTSAYVAGVVHNAHIYIVIKTLKFRYVHGQHGVSPTGYSYQDKLVPKTITLSAWFLNLSPFLAE